MPVTHSDGFGDTWMDFTALNTYDSSEALSACTAWSDAHGVSNGCRVDTSNCGSGGASSITVNISAPAFGTSPVAIWIFSGTETGHIGSGGSSFTCNASGTVWH